MKYLQNIKFSYRSILKGTIFLSFIFFRFVLMAQNYPENVELNSINYTPYKPPTGTTPGYLEVRINEFGNEVTRISDASVFGTTSSNLRHHYAVDQPWNSDGSLIKLAGYPAAILDGKTNKFLYWASIPSSATWSNTQRYLMYGTSKNKLVRYNVNKNTSETLHTFSGYTSIDYGRNKGNMSIDDKYIGLIGMNGSNQTLIVYNIESNQVVGTKDVGTLGFNWFSVSPTGTYTVLYFEEHGKSINEGINVMEIDLTNLRHLNDYTSHSDLGINSDGDDIFIAFGDPITRPKDYYMKMVRLSDGLVTPFFHYTKSQGIWGGHISCRNTDRPGWAYVSDAVTTTVAQKEIFAIKLDGSDQIERFAIYHSDYIKGYGHQAHAVPNRNGTKVMFASNWNNAFTGNYPPSFIVQAPITLKADDEAIPGNIMVYPNPSKDGLIHIKPHSSIVIEAIIVYDVWGRKIKTEVIDVKKEILNLSNLPKGVYLLNFQTEKGGSITKRIVLI